MNNIGILMNPECRKLFEKINNRPFCKECQEKRAAFKEKEQKKGHYSNLLPGFSSLKINIPLDILIIGEAHGGRENLFREQKSLDSEVIEFNYFYRYEKLVTFHQKQMRELFDYLDNVNKTWVFTDLIKCFVWRKKRENEKIAISFCRRYLNEQIDFFKPRLILAIGIKVCKEYFGIKIDKLKHGKKYEISGKKIISCIFPSRNTADIWIENGGWEKIKEALNNSF
ncbi:MAG: uracil-DNA glycosylase family protein [Candidatus Aenigmatarchaeota archaeon]